MSKWLLAGLGLLLVAEAARAQRPGCVTTRASEPAGSIRCAVDTLTEAQVQALRKGVAVMKSRDSAPRDSADFRRSWVFWANMHAHLGPGSPWGRLPSALPAGFPVANWTRTNDSERALWMRCAHGNDYFLAWHRAYLYYFEQVLREAAGDPTLTVPYWDYTHDQVGDGTWSSAGVALPPILREPFLVLAGSSDPLPNSLFVPDEFRNGNDGSAVLLPASVDIDASFTELNLFPAGFSDGFQTRIESEPHNLVHGDIGGKAEGFPGFMANPGMAALDPIFYLHHTNVDRLWSCWENQDPDVRKLDASRDALYLSETFHFVDGTGTVITATLAKHLEAAAATGYDGVGHCPAAPAAPPAPFEPLEVVAGSEPLSVLSTGSRSVRIASQLKEVRLPLSQELRERVVELGKKGGRWVLQLDGIAAKSRPRRDLRVTLASAENPERRVVVGALTFFSFLPEAGQGGRGGGLSRRFDVTGALAELGGDPARLIVRFEPIEGGGGGAFPGGVVLAGAASEDAEVRIETVELLSLP